MKWFRMYSEILNDPKMVDLTTTDYGVWVKLLALANQQSERGFIRLRSARGQAIGTLSTLLRHRKDRLRTTLDLFKERGMIDFDLDGKEGWLEITNWNKKQFQSDDVTARTRKHKQKERSHERTRTEQIRTEQIQIPEHSHFPGAKEVLDYLNEKAGKQFSSMNENLEHILQRLREGYTVDQCRRVVDLKIQDEYFIDNPRYLNPETLFKANNFDKYLNEKPKKPLTVVKRKYRLLK